MSYKKAKQTKKAKAKHNQQKNQMAGNSTQTQAQQPVQPQTTQTNQVLQETQMQHIQRESKYALPVAEIKKDLIKTGFFAVFAVGIILVLNYFLPDTGISLKFDLSRYKFF